MEYESSIKEIINSALDQVRTIIDADTVVGKQITTPSGTVIIPISKVSMGFASGGLDFPAKSEDTSKNFGGGGGTGVTVSPIGFLAVYSDGRVEMLPMTVEKASPIEQLADILDQTPAIINRIRSAINGKDEEEFSEEELNKIEQEYAEEPVDDATANLSEKELKKLRKQEAKAAKRAKRDSELDF